MRKTNRGFSYKEFKDAAGNVCSIQKSSRADKDCIWLGNNKIDLKGFYPSTSNPWRDLTDEQIKEKFGCTDIVANNRMELSITQVKKLIPLLQKFIETGEIS